MDDSIRTYCNSMASFSNHLQSSCDALKTSIDRRPIPLATASSTFIHSLNRRVSAASAHLNLLETMSFDTVSFEELLGHCNEVFKDNQTRLLHLQDRLQPFGYVPEIEIDEDDDVSTPITEQDGSDAPEDDDDLLDESLSLKKLGLSDASLATLAFQANARNEDQDVSFPSKDSSGASGLSDSGEAEDKQMIALAPLQLVKVCRDDYECLPSYMKSLAPWEDLLAAVEKINSGLKQKTSGGNFFHQDEISSLGLGSGIRAIGKHYIPRERGQGRMPTHEYDFLSTFDSSSVGGGNDEPYTYGQNLTMPYSTYSMPYGVQSTESSDTSWSQSDVQSFNDYGYGQGQALPNPYNFQYGNPQSIPLDPYGWHVSQYMQNYKGEVSFNDYSSQYTEDSTQRNDEDSENYVPHRSSMWL